MNVKPVASRQAFGEALARLGEEFHNIVVLEADLGKSTKSDLFGAKFPERYFEMGIAEQNMLGVASGLAFANKTAFCCSFACFVAGRFETIKMSVAYANANVKIVGTHAGVGIGPDGYSQMGLEDIALMRVLPLMQVFQPADDIETAQIVRYLAEHEGPAYLRLTRQNLDRVHDESYRFFPGKLDVIAEGKDVAIFATGGTVMHAKKAREALKAKNIDCAVVNVPSIKPLDSADVIDWAKKVKTIVTVEDHSIVAGMGSAIAEVVCSEGLGTRVVRHGIFDTFGESGSPESLYAKFELDADGIEKAVLRALHQKT